MTCPSCGTENRAGAKFCVDCGTELSQRCAACGTPFDSGRFCAECGEPLPGIAAVPPKQADDRPAPEAERRLVSVVFADLVGFTTLSESNSARAEPQFEASSRLFRGLGMPFPLAVSLLERGELLRSEGRAGEGEPLLAEAREIFERLKARPWIERATRSEGLRAEVVTG